MASRIMMIEVKANKYLGDSNQKKMHTMEIGYILKDNNSAVRLKSLSKLFFHDLAS